MVLLLTRKRKTVVDSMFVASSKSAAASSVHQPINHVYGESTLYMLLRTSSGAS